METKVSKSSEKRARKQQWKLLRKSKDTETVEASTRHLSDEQRRRVADNVQRAKAKCARRPRMTVALVPYVTRRVHDPSGCGIPNDRVTVTSKVLARTMNFTRLCYDEHRDQLYAIERHHSIWHMTREAAMLICSFPMLNDAPKDLEIESLHMLPPGHAVQMVIGTSDGRLWTLIDQTVTELRVVDVECAQPSEAVAGLHVRHMDVEGRLLASTPEHLCRVDVLTKERATLRRMVRKVVWEVTSDKRGTLYVLDNELKLFTVHPETYEVTSFTCTMPEPAVRPCALQNLRCDPFSDSLLVTDFIQVYQIDLGQSDRKMRTVYDAHLSGLSAPIIRRRHHLGLLIALQRAPPFTHWPPGLAQLIEAYARPTTLVILGNHGIIVHVTFRDLSGQKATV